MSVYDLPQIVATALPPASNAANICSGFKVAVIIPFNRHIFQDADFLPSSVTDRPNLHESKTPSVASEAPAILTQKIAKKITIWTPQQIATSFASSLRYCSDVAHRRPTKLCTMLSHLLGWYTIYTFLGSLIP